MRAAPSVRAILLDTGPLGLAANPQASAEGDACNRSALAGLMPARAPRLSSGQWGGADTPSGDTRHPCRPESESDVVCESDTPPAPAAAAPPPDLVALLTRAGVFPSAAPRLLDT